MTILVVLMGFLVMGIGALGCARPEGLIRFISGMDSKKRYYWAVGMRIFLGALLISAAPLCRMTTFVQALGFFTIGAALILAFRGDERLSTLVQWWAERPPSFIQSWCAASILFGALLVYVGL